MTNLYVLGVVGVFRKCRKCGEWKKLGNFSQGDKTCHLCRLPMTDIANHQSMRRAMVITDSGRAYLRELREREARSA